MRNRFSKYQNRGRKPVRLSRDERFIRATQEIQNYYSLTGSTAPETVVEDIKRKWGL